MRTKFGWEGLREQTTRKPHAQMEGNIKMYLRETRFGGVDYIHLARDRDRWRAVVNTAMNLWVP
jgi:hypothetical protein